MRKNPTLQDTEPNLALCNYVTWLYVTWLYVTSLYVTCPRALHERTLCDAFGKKRKKKKRFMVLNDNLLENKKLIYQIYESVTDEPRSFLYIKLLQKDPNHIFMKNFSHCLKITN